VTRAGGLKKAHLSFAPFLRILRFGFWNSDPAYEFSVTHTCSPHTTMASLTMSMSVMSVSAPVKVRARAPTLAYSRDVHTPGI